ncbi:DUF1802 family protein [Paenibacillus gansuensis]|uniref:DUF1802 family protein n=1 Tax=Paenibacillus gansuensis TaxID=306542 RepID=A0ABW5PGF0_9BACL
MASESMALKEWAVITKALLEGEQAVILRKGGIEEETKHFEVKSSSFFLYPTYEHQKSEWVREPYHGKINDTLLQWDRTGNTVTIVGYAEVVEDIEIYQEEVLHKAGPFHIGTEEFAEGRLKWKKNQPLHLLVLRVYRLEKPVTVPVIPDYLGCRSWVQVQEDLAAAGGKKIPVLSDAEFHQMYREIKARLAETE